MFISMMVLIAVVLTARDAAGCFRDKEWKLVLLQGVLILAGLGLSLLIQLGLQLPSVAGAIITVVKKYLPFIPAFFGD